MQAMLVWSLGCKDTLEKEMAIHSSILSWEIPWSEEPARLQRKSQTQLNDWRTTSLWLAGCPSLTSEHRRMRTSPTSQESCKHHIGWGMWSKWTTQSLSKGKPAVHSNWWSRTDTLSCWEHISEGFVDFLLNIRIKRTNKQKPSAGQNTLSNTADKCENWYSRTFLEDNLLI